MFDAAVNHVLRAESWAKERLKPYASKTMRFSVPPFSVSLTVTSGGEVAKAAVAAVPDATIALTPLLLLRILGRDEAAFKQVEIAGDNEFSGEIAYIAKNLRWDVEEDLSRIFGDIIAQRIVRTLGGFTTWGKQSFESLGRSFSEYWTEEQPLIAKSTPVKQFIAEVDALRDDVERLEKRLQNISR